MTYITWKINEQLDKLGKLAAKVKVDTNPFKDPSGSFFTLKAQDEYSAAWLSGAIIAINSLEKYPQLIIQKLEEVRRRKVSVLVPSQAIRRELFMKRFEDGNEDLFTSKWVCCDAKEINPLQQLVYLKIDQWSYDYIFNAPRHGYVRWSGLSVQFRDPAKRKSDNDQPEMVGKVRI